MRHLRKTKPSPTTRQSLEDLERERRLLETKQVIYQPHRAGYDGDMADQFGVFVRTYECGRPCWEAGQYYIELVAKWRSASDIPQRWITSEKGSGVELDGESVEKWFKQIKACENAMKCSGIAAFNAAQSLILDDVYPTASLFQPVKRAIHSLAVQLGKIQS